MKEVDVLVGPSTTTVAPDFESKTEQEPVEAYTDDILTVGVNLAGIPSLNIPVGFFENMPVGMQIIGDYFDEATLYQVGYAFEQATNYHKQYPALEGGTKE